MKKVISENPIVILASSKYDCGDAINQPIVQKDLENCRSEKRRDEIIYTRSLIYNELGIEEIQKDEIGRPALPKGDISISHSGELYGIAYSPDFQMGLDIEIISDKPARIKEKFRNQYELDFDQSDLEITRLWTLKEAVYKFLARPGVLFAEQIHISKLEEGLYKAEYRIDGKVKETLHLKSFVLNDYCVSFVLTK